MSFKDSWKKLTNEAVSVGKDLAEQSKLALDSAAEKSKGLAEQGKLALDNQKQQQAIEEAKAKIGAYVAESNLFSEDEFVTEQMAVIAAAQEAMEKNAARIAELKAPKVKPEPEEPIVERVVEPAPAHVCTLRFCSKCGAQVRTDAVFCQACGNKL